jgi:virginiamycin B lyase
LVDAALEERQLLALAVGTFESPAVALTSQDITKGSNGNLWFTEPGVGKIGEMTPSGIVTEFPLPAGQNASGAITSGPDGNLWFTGGNSVGRITTSGVVTQFEVAPSAHLTGITSGSDGNLWFMDTDNFKIGQITTSGVITEFPIPPATTLKTADGINLFHDIAAGPDGNLWFTAEVYNHQTKSELGEIGRVTPAGQVTTFLLSPGTVVRSTNKGTTHSKPHGGMLADAITAGPDGNVWFTEHQANGIGGIGRITPSGKISQYAIPTTPKGAPIPAISTAITTGPDGNLWFNLASDDFLNGPNPAPYFGRVTPTGTVSIFVIPNAKDAQAALLAEGADSLISGPEGKLWFTSSTRRFISSTGRVIGTITPPVRR